MNKSIIINILLLLIVADSSAKSYFIENKGQWHQDVLFATRIKGMNAWIKKDGIVFDFYKTRGADEHSFHTGHVVAMDLVNSQHAAYPKAILQMPGYHNYFIGNHPAQWQSEVRLFEEVIIEEVYPGISIRYYFEGGLLRYDFLLKPGADATQIAFQIDGCDTKLDQQSNALIFDTQLGEISQKDLLTYQTYQGRRKALKSKFQLKGNVLKIEVKGHNPSEAMVIDPLIFSTFIGGEASEKLYAMEKDNDGNLVVCGTSPGFGFPTTTGAYSETAQTGGDDAYISKLASDGTQLIFSTFYGGTNQDLCQGLALDANDNIFITGSTRSQNLPVTAGAYDESYNTSGSLNNFDIYVAKLNSTGSSLLYATFLGDNGDDFGRSISTDSEGNAYIAGSSKSFNFPTTTGAFQTNYNGEGWNNVVVCKLNSAGSSLVYSTYVGGSSADDANYIAIGPDGSAFVTGTAFSANFPTTAGSIKPIKTGNRDAFVFRLNPSGSALIYSTFVGGNSLDDGFSIAVDEQNNAYVTGLTISPDFPVTAGVFNSVAGDGENVFISKINPAGSAYIFSGLLGGNGRDVGHCIRIGSDNTILLCGETNSAGFQLTPNAHLSTILGFNEVFVSKISMDGSTLIYSSLFGGNSFEIGYAILDDGADKLIVAGVTGGGNFPVTDGAFDNTFNSGNDAFISKISLICQPVGLNATTNSPICAGQDLTLTGLPSGMVSYSWSGPGNYSSNNQNASISSTTSSNSGQYTFTTVDSDGCEGSVTLNVQVTDINLQVIQNETSLSAQQEDGAFYQWLDCNQNLAAIADEQGQSFSFEGSGSFAVEISLQGCIDTTACVVVANVMDMPTDLFSLYPNPAESILNIKIDDNSLSNYVIYDASGRKIQTGITNYKLDISNLKPGLYTLQLQGKKHFNHQKFIKN